MPTMTSMKNGRSITVNNVTKEFREAYADAVNEWASEEDLQALVNRRHLEWEASRRIPLKNAAWCYSQISGGYNEFRPHMIPHLSSVFHADKIEVTAAREYSVAIYLHVRDDRDLRQRIEAFVNQHFHADIVSWVDDGTMRIWWD